MKTTTELQEDERKRIAAEKETARLEALLNQQQSTTGEPLNQTPLVEKIIDSDDNDLFGVAIKAYKEKFSGWFANPAWYKEPIKNKDGSLSLCFKDEQTATSFFNDLAKKGNKFIVRDAETKEVTGYSDGSTFHRNTDNKTLDQIIEELSQKNSNGPSMR